MGLFQFQQIFCEVHAEYETDRGVVVYLFERLGYGEEGRGCVSGLGQSATEQVPLATNL